MMSSEERKNLEQIMYSIVPNQGTVIATYISLNQDTKFKVNFDLYKNYLYIIFSEETVKAPFIYNKSYSFEELKNIHAIFKACEDLEEVKKRINDLFKKKRISINLTEKGEKLEMILEPDFWIGKTSIKFELKKEMVPKYEKGKKMIELYDIVKKNFIKLQNISNYIQSNKNENPIFINLIRKFEEYNIPYINSVQNLNNLKNENKNYKYDLQYDSEIFFNLNEINEDNKPIFEIKLTIQGENLLNFNQKIDIVFIEKESGIKKPVEIKKIRHNVHKNEQKWSILVTLQKEDPGEYIAFFNLENNEQIIKDKKVIVVIIFN